MTKATSRSPDFQKVLVQTRSWQLCLFAFVKKFSVLIRFGPGRIEVPPSRLYETCISELENEILQSASLKIEEAICVYKLVIESSMICLHLRESTDRCVVETSAPTAARISLTGSSPTPW